MLFFIDLRICSSSLSMKYLKEQSNIFGKQKGYGEYLVDSESSKDKPSPFGAFGGTHKIYSINC